MFSVLRHSALVMITLLSASCAAAQQGSTGLNFKLGDDVATVKAALGASGEPEPMARNTALPANMDPNRGKTFFHLRTKGVWAFFNAQGTLETIRLDAPYAGKVRGIGLGDSAAKLKATLGPPIKKPFAAFITMERYQYVLDDSAYVSFDTNDDGVQNIFINR
jgi:hypothetical protein